jgi:hypothetical protein
MFNWNRRPKRTAETEAIPSLPIGKEIGTPSPSARIVAKLVQKGPMFSEAIFTESKRRWCALSRIHHIDKLLDQLRYLNTITDIRILDINRSSRNLQKCTKSESKLLFPH